mmetsp:Transcript_27502/g.69998  ORF Transcript_27502/g.69998 Transcript_27502/m.69998 type:complete len:292 (-) Transcript_27502:411-1286(-)
MTRTRMGSLTSRSSSRSCTTGCCWTASCPSTRPRSTRSTPRATAPSARRSWRSCSRCWATRCLLRSWWTSCRSTTRTRAARLSSTSSCSCSGTSSSTSRRCRSTWVRPRVLRASQQTRCWTPLRATLHSSSLKRSLTRRWRARRRAASCSCCSPRSRGAGPARGCSAPLRRWRTPTRTRRCGSSCLATPTSRPRTCSRTASRSAPPPRSSCSRARRSCTRRRAPARRSWRTASALRWPATPSCQLRCCIPPSRRPLHRLRRSHDSQQHSLEDLRCAQHLAAEATGCGTFPW